MRLSACLLAVALAFAGFNPACAGSPDDFRVTNLPDLKEKPNFEQYAGYLTSDQAAGDKLFFWLFKSQTNPDTDPLVIWLSGGPGCSSISSMFEENGPLRLHDGKVELSTTSWNKRANIVYIDQPVQTGLSFSKTGHFVQNQNQINVAFYEFLKNFYANFPEFKGRKLFITGESYAGHFIPAIATYILEMRGRPGALDIALGGLAIGNGWIHPPTHIGIAADVSNAAGVIDAAHRDTANKLYRNAVAQGALVKGRPLDAPAIGAPPPTPQIDPFTPYPGLVLPASLANNPAAQELATVLNSYKGQPLGVKLTNKDFIAIIDALVKGPPELRALVPEVIRIQFDGKSDAQLVYDYLLARIVTYTADAAGNSVNIMDLLNYGPVSMIGTPTAWPPGDNSFTKYMSRKDVQAALHASEFPSDKMEACNATVYFYLGGDYYKSSLPLFPDLLKRMPILLYNGQNDLICAPAGTAKFLRRMAADPAVPAWVGKQDFPKAPYRPWNFQGRRAGYYQSVGNLNFLVVLNASHMVPLSVPGPAQEMIGRFLHGEWPPSSGVTAVGGGAGQAGKGVQ